MGSDFTTWSGGTPLFGLWCRRKGHRPGPWRDTYQPHVQEQDCLRCGAWRLRDKKIT